jgi:hypothetical protein
MVTLYAVPCCKRTCNSDWQLLNNSWSPDLTGYQRPPLAHQGIGEFLRGGTFPVPASLPFRPARLRPLWQRLPPHAGGFAPPAAPPARGPTDGPGGTARNSPPACGRSSSSWEENGDALRIFMWHLGLQH